MMSMLLTYAFRQARFRSFKNWPRTPGPCEEQLTGKPALTTEAKS